MKNLKTTRRQFVAGAAAVLTPIGAKTASAVQALVGKDVDDQVDAQAQAVQAQVKEPVVEESFDYDNELARTMEHNTAWVYYFEKNGRLSM